MTKDYVKGNVLSQADHAMTQLRVHRLGKYIARGNRAAAARIDGLNEEMIIANIRNIGEHHYGPR